MRTTKLESLYPKFLGPEEKFLNGAEDLPQKLDASVTEYIKRRKQRSSHLESLTSELREFNRKYSAQTGMHHKVEMALRESQAVLDQFERTRSRSTTSTASFISRIFSQLSDFISYLFNIFSAKKINFPN